MLLELKEKFGIEASNEEEATEKLIELMLEKTELSEDDLRGQSLEDIVLIAESMLEDAAIKETPAERKASEKKTVPAKKTESPKKEKVEKISQKDNVKDEKAQRIAEKVKAASKPVEKVQKEKTNRPNNLKNTANSDIRGFRPKDNAEDEKIISVFMKKFFNEKDHVFSVLKEGFTAYIESRVGRKAIVSFDKLKMTKSTGVVFGGLYFNAFRGRKEKLEAHLERLMVDAVIELPQGLPMIKVDMEKAIEILSDKEIMDDMNNFLAKTIEKTSENRKKMEEKLAANQNGETKKRGNVENLNKNRAKK